MKSKKTDRSDERIPKPVSGQKQTSKPGASGVPGEGGSRQGNIGHQRVEENDNSHR